MRFACIVLVACVLQAAEPEVNQSRALQMASVEKQKASTRIQQAAIAERHPSVFLASRGPSWADAVAAIPCEPSSPSEIRDIVDQGAQRMGLDAKLVRAVVRKESAYNPCATSTKGAQGLMQLMPMVQLQFGVTNPYDPKQNVDAGAKLLKQLLDQYGGDLVKALAAYNAGPARIEQFGGVPPFPETVNYVSGILDDLSPKQ